MQQYMPFKKATPVWAEGRSEEKNCTLGLYTSVDGGENATLRIAVSGFYRLYVNGKFAFYGPARHGEGYSRVDEIPLTLPVGKVHIAIETINYAINSFCYICMAGFVTAELEMDGAVVAATGDKGFSCFNLTQRVRRIQRYSYQRPAAEAYRLTPAYADWRQGIPCENAVPVNVAAAKSNILAPRRIPLNTFPLAPFVKTVAQGNFASGVTPRAYRKDRSLTYPADPKMLLMGFTEAELEWHLSDEAEECKTLEFKTVDQPFNGTTLTAGQFQILALPCAKTGFLTMHISCERAGTLYVFFDETLCSTGDVDPLCRTCCNVIRLDMEAGDYLFEAQEPFGMKYMKLAAKSGTFTVKDSAIRELICPQPITATYTGKDPKLAAVFEAGKETFLQCSSDLFMDCPTRERAGWLCDSFFTARAEREFTGDNVIEYNFLENFLKPDTFRNLPQGMLPMCYPSDHYNGSFIPNWAMWFVLELEDCLKRTGNAVFIAQFKERVYALLDWFTQYENKEGLLEYLPGWVFVEWSKANDLVQDINYPSNMMYARMLEAAASLYDDPALKEKADALKEKIRELSFDGTFFTDNAVYKDGVAVNTGERTEVCQYYAFFTGVATPKTYPALWEILVNDFGPRRKDTGAYPEIHPANAFIGNYLRLMLLEDDGRYAQLLSEIKDYFYYMAERTGTLWEHISTRASCIHGFASYVVHFIRVAEEHLSR